MKTTFNNIENMENMEMQKEYKLRYFYGAWVTSEVIWASDDAEAIFDAKEAIETDKLTYRLYCGKRIVKEWTNKYNNELNNY